MKNNIFVWLIITGVTIIVSCNSSEPSENRRMVAESKILQQNDGTISLKIEKAACYRDAANPSTNTAEWSMFVSKAGRYDVWLSSATRDTTDLRYNDAVMLSIRDKRLEMKPSVNRVIQNSSEVEKPYYQADSFMGSLYIQDTGVYRVQVISDRVLPRETRLTGTKGEDLAKIVSVSLKPSR